MVVLAAGLFATWLVVFRGNLTFYSAQGRYLYPGLAAVAVGIGLGLIEALRPGRPLRTVGAAGLLLMAIHPLVFRFLPEYYPFRSRVERPLVVRYENLGHSYLASSPLEGTYFEAGGGFASRLNPDLQIARGRPRIRHRFERLPAAVGLRVRLRFGEAIPGMRPGTFFVQSLDLGGVRVAGALTITPEPRELVFVVPGYPGSTNSLDVVLSPVPGFGSFASASEIWVERFPVFPRGLVLLTNSTVRRGERISVELTLENIHPTESVACQVGLELESGPATRWLGRPTPLELDPGETRTIRLESGPPESFPTGPCRLRASFALVDGGPFVDLNPCLATLSVGKMEPHPKAFGRFRIRSQPAAERGTPVTGNPGQDQHGKGDIANDEVALHAIVPVPPMPPGRYRVRVDAWFGRETQGLEVRVLTADGRRMASTRRSLERPDEHDPADRVPLETAFDWPGGPGRIALVGKGDVSVDRIRVVPVWVPGINLIAFPHAPAIDVR